MAGLLTLVAWGVLILGDAGDNFGVTAELLAPDTWGDLILGEAAGEFGIIEGAATSDRT